MIPPQARVPPEGAAAADGVHAVAAYVVEAGTASRATHQAAYRCLLDSLATALTALSRPECRRLIGPVVPGATMIQGSRLPGTSIELDPVAAAFSLGVLLRWPHGEEPAASAWGHPGDALGAILAAADYAARKAHNEARRPVTVRDLQDAMIKASEIQAAWVADLDLASRVRIASAAIVTPLFGGGRAAIERAVRDAVSEAAAIAGDASRRSRFVLGDAASRGLRLALRALADESAEAPSTPVPSTRLPTAPGPSPPDRPLATHCMDAVGLRLGALDGAARPEARFDAAVGAHFGARQRALIRARFAEPDCVAAMPVNEFIAALVCNR